MNTQTEKKSQTRLIVATSLFALSILASFLMTYLSHMGEQYWVLTRPLPRGVQIAANDLKLVKATLDPSIDSYLESKSNPLGSITLRNLGSGRFISRTDISSDSSALTSENISIAVRATDLPMGVNIGDTVSLYQVQDSRSGEVPAPPNLVISGAFIEEISRGGANFSSDVSITISIDRAEVPSVLSATATGRIVVASSHG
jgi:hypothetical protein